MLQNNSKALEIDKSGRILKISIRKNIIRYEFKNNKIIKTVNNTGNITLLNNVKMRNLYY